MLVAVLAAGIALYITAHIALIILSPKPMTPTAEEKTFLSASSPTKPQPLPSLSDPASVQLSVVVPAYNESTRLPPMLRTTLAHLASVRPARTYEVLIVDDGSSDSTSAVALTLASAHPKEDIRVVRLRRNRGKGAAVKHGFLHARGERILMVDADGASRFEDLEKLWEEMDKIEKDGQGVVVGSRAHLVGTEAVVKRSLVRNILMHGFHFLLRTFGVGHIRDTQCGFKLFTRTTSQSLFPSLHITNWIFDVELLLLARMLRVPVAEVPVAWEEVAGSKIRLLWDSLGMLTDLIVIRGNYALGRWRPVSVGAGKKVD
ncbi:glycosyltransferase family 2 protein [Botryobasidium botryosum FD-172 SS1]|uniref:dolichyl-phosphate beta-glucosyltransferase n=1 Tax=Botryobasidium botryosum (strain FD-172 SS1) TaxID=930990 RepID=A0A067MY21_BOTB1|nr:glycosyltransferase family 2 protein [Botryobasidium botryosum FD-172 SS1]